MQKIGSITSTANASGEWTNGNVAAGTPPTIIDAAWLNTVQREIANVVINAGLTLDPANDAQLLAALKLLTGPGRLLSAPKVFSASGTYTPTPGTTKIRVKVWGAGGGGSGALNSAAQGACSGGGGAYAETWMPITAGSTTSVTVGSGGTAGGANSTISGGAGVHHRSALLWSAQAVRVEQLLFLVSEG